MIQIFSLVSGLDILADVETQCPTTYTLDKPVRVIAQADEKGQVQIGMVPWAPALFVDGTSVKLYKEHLLLEPTEPARELVEQYANLYGKILVPPTKLSSVH